MSAASIRRHVLILAASQAIFQTASVLVVTVGSLAAAQIAPSAGLATLPVATMVLGTALATVPASLWMNRAGRRSGFLAGALLGTAGGLLASLGVWIGSLAMLCLGTLLVGSWQGFAQFYRFAASEIAGEGFKSRAISYVLAGGVAAAFAGPFVGRLGVPLFEPAYLGSFVLLALVALVGVVTLLNLRIPPPARHEAAAGGRPWREIVSQPAYAVALFGAATGGGVMTLAMTATPLAMAEHHHSLSSTAMVIQLHVLGMFVPSFFTGALVSRFGALPVMLAGVAILAGHVLTTLSGVGFGSFAAALALLGLGWNFLYVGGTSLLTTTYTDAEKGRAQATNDMTIFVVAVACSFGAGALLDHSGWLALNLLTLPWLAIAALALSWHAARSRGRTGDVTKVGP